MIPNEAALMLCHDLRRILSKGGTEETRAALRRLTLFEMMHVENSPMSNPGRKIVMLADGNTPYIADELQSDGRLHIMQEHRYAVFNRSDMTLEYQKVEIDIVEVIYEGDDWPDDLVEPSYENIITYFFGDLP